MTEMFSKTYMPGVQKQVYRMGIAGNYGIDS